MPVTLQKRFGLEQHQESLLAESWSVHEATAAPSILTRQRPKRGLAKRMVEGLVVKIVESPGAANIQAAGRTSVAPWQRVADEGS